MLANYGRKAVAHLPALNVTGTQKPLVQVLDEGGKEVLYALRVDPKGFRAPVFAPGKYTLRVSDPESGRVKELNSVAAVAGDVPPLKVNL